MRTMLSGFLDSLPVFGSYTLPPELYIAPPFDYDSDGDLDLLQASYDVVSKNEYTIF